MPLVARSKGAEAKQRHTLKTKQASCVSVCVYGGGLDHDSIKANVFPFSYEGLVASVHQTAPAHNLLLLLLALLFHIFFLHFFSEKTAKENNIATAQISLHWLGIFG